MITTADGPPRSRLAEYSRLISESGERSVTAGAIYNLNELPKAEDVQQAAGALAVDAPLIEKDWHVAQILALLHAAEIPMIFSGGTCLAKAHGIIKRFSEDIDLLCCLPPGTGRRARKAAINQLREMVKGEGYTLLSIQNHNNYQFAEQYFSYPRDLGGDAPMPTGLRPEIRLDLRVVAPRDIATVTLPVSSFVAMHRGDAPEVAEMICASIEDICAGKLSVLTWKLCSSYCGTKPEAYEPELSRHLHDLAAASPRLLQSEDFADKAALLIKSDWQERGGMAQLGSLKEAAQKLRDAIDARDSLARDYEDFVGNHVYGEERERIHFNQARDVALALYEKIAR